jgi:hypothetical protein
LYLTLHNYEKQSSVGINAIKPGDLNVYNSANIIRTMKARKKRWAEHAEYVGEKRNAYNILLRKPENKGGHLADLVVQERMILKWILKR